MEQFGGGAPSMGAFGDNGLHAPLLHKKKNPADAEMGAFYGDAAPAPDNAERVVSLLLHGKNHADVDGVPARENVERVAALLLHKKNPADGEMDAFDGNGVPALLLHKNNAADFEMGAFYITACLPATEYSDGLVVFPGDDDASPLLLGSNRSAEKGSVYHFDSGVLVPSPENLMPAYAVQVSVDAAGGAKAGEPIAVDIKADAGEEKEEVVEEAGNDRGSISAMIGIVAASSAATALAAGAVGPVTAFGLFAVLVGGLSLAMASVRAA